MVKHRMIYFSFSPVELKILFSNVSLTPAVNEYVIPRLPSVWLRPVAVIPYIISPTKIISMCNDTVIIIAFMMNDMSNFESIGHF